MSIGFIGAGIFAQKMAKHVLPFGHQVVFFYLLFASNVSSLDFRLSEAAGLN